jgi:hypothetical protein
MRFGVIATLRGEWVGAEPTDQPTLSKVSFSPYTAGARDIPASPIAAPDASPRFVKYPEPIGYSHESSDGVQS